MNYITLSLTISAPDGQEAREEPCFVKQQQDTDDTVGCSGDLGLLNELLRFMGFDIPYPTEQEDYSTSVVIKPKDAYTNLNVSLSNGDLSAPRWEQTDKSQTVSISSSDFVESDSGGYVDLAAKLDLVNDDKIRSASWVGTVYDSALSAITPKPIVNIDSDNQLQLPQAVNAELLVRFSETAQVYDINILPRDGETENAYQSSLIIQPEGCDGKPSRYEINVPGCYKNKLGLPGYGDVAVTDPPPPAFVEQSDIEKEWCVCGNHQLKGVYPKSAEPDDIENICYGGPCDQIIEPDCVSDGREDDEYC